MKKHILIPLFLSYLIVLVSFGCAPKKEIQIVPKSPIEMGDYLWSRGRYVDACKNYEMAVKDPLLSHDKKLFLIKRIIKCSLDSNDGDKTYLYLNEWKSIDPDYSLKWEYHTYVLKYLQIKGDIKAYENYLEDLLNNTPLTSLRKKSFVLLEMTYLRQQDIYRARKLFSKWYEEFDNTEQIDILKQIIAKLKEDKKLVYNLKSSKLIPFHLPDGVILWIDTVENLNSGKMSWSDAYSLLQKILTENPQISKTSSIFLREFEKLKKHYGVPTVELVMILPFDPPYKKISFGILRGVETGIFEYESLGIEVKLTVLNSNSNTWLEDLNSLAKDDMIVGGPIKLDTWNKILQTDLQGKVHFFAFRANLPFEGTKGFRFFSSHRDQVKALIKFFEENFQVRSFGIFYPKSQYGRKLGEVFFNEAKEMNATVNKIYWYEENDTKNWQKRVSEFLRVPEDVIGDDEKIKKFVPDIDVSAVFIPDTLEKARIIIPNFFYFNASNLYFLGTALWNTSKVYLSPLEKNMLRRSYFPSPWLDDNSNFKLKTFKKEVFFLSKENVDFWKCLGYDFFRFAVGLINRLKKNNNIISVLNDEEFKWTIGPIRWDEKGIGTQKMYILNVVTHQK